MSKILIQDFNRIYKDSNCNKLFKNKTVLITGASGFIGSYLTNYFIYKFNNLKLKKIILLDLNLKNLNKNIYFNYDKKKVILKRFDIINMNISNLKQKIDIILHAASIASPSYYRKFPLETALSNTNGLKTILDYSLKQKVKRILFFSSSEIYGNPDKKNIPTTEDYNGNVSPVGPRACYDESKRFGETLCYIYANKFNLPLRVVRPFNNFGPLMNINDKRLPADLAKMVLKKKDILLYSNGSPKRTFCYISDAICGYLKILRYKKYDYFNIGSSNKEISVKKLAQIFKSKAKKIFNVDLKIKFKISNDKEYLVDNPSRRKPNLVKSRKLLNFKSKISTERGVENYLNFLKEQM